MADSQSRKWVLVINNPFEKGFDHDKIRNILSGIKSILYYCCADECGEQGTHHTHLYLCCSSPVRFSTLKNNFPEAHLEVARGTSEQNKDYIQKGGKWAEDQKHDTSIAGSFEEWGEMPIERQGKRNDLDTLYNMVKSGYSNYEILENNPGYMLRINDIERARQTVRAEQFRKQFRKLDVTYMWGATGLGKTRSVMEKFNYEEVFRIVDYKNPFDNYFGENTVLFDEFHAQFSVPQLLNFLDGYPLELPARYANKIACYTQVYIISNIDLVQQYRAIQFEQPETWKALLRRINHVVMFLPGGQRKEYTTDEYVNGFVEMSVHDLPFGEDDSAPVKMPVDAGVQLRIEKEPNWDSIGKQEGRAEHNGG